MYHRRTRDVTRLLKRFETWCGSGRAVIGMDLAHGHADVAVTAGLMQGLAKPVAPSELGVDDPRELLARYGWQATVASPGDPEVSYGRWPFPPAPRGVPGMPRSFFVKAVRAND